MSTQLLDPELNVTPDQKVPCVLLLDTSGSMQGARIAALNTGLRAFKEQVVQDTGVAARVDLCVITFDSEVTVVRDFGPVDSFDPPTLTAQNQTFLGTGILEALDKIAARKETLNATGIPYYRPWLFIITDGLPEGEEPSVLAEASAKLKRHQEKGRCIVFTVAVGDDVDLNALQQITGGPPKLLSGLSFTALFEWLGKSLEGVSKSRSGSQLSLPPTPWATVTT